MSGQEGTQYLHRTPAMDEKLRRLYIDRWVKCPKGHLNSPNARICWNCGAKIELAICERQRPRSDA